MGLVAAAAAAVAARPKILRRLAVAVVSVCSSGLLRVLTPFDRLADRAPWTQPCGQRRGPEWRTSPYNRTSAPTQCHERRCCVHGCSAQSDRRGRTRRAPCVGCCVHSPVGSRDQPVRPGPKVRVLRGACSAHRSATRLRPLHERFSRKLSLHQHAVVGAAAGRGRVRLGRTKRCRALHPAVRRRRGPTRRPRPAATVRRRRHYHRQPAAGRAGPVGFARASRADSRTAGHAAPGPCNCNSSVSERKAEKNKHSAPWKRSEKQRKTKLLHSYDRGCRLQPGRTRCPYRTRSC